MSYRRPPVSLHGGLSICLLIVLLIVVVQGTNRAAESGATIDFNRQVRPLLANICYRCHGPDTAERKADLRLDTESGLLAAVERHRPEASELVRRIASDDPDERMPPPSSGKTLTADDVRVLTEWVRQGAPYARHWSYVRPQRPPEPEVDDPSWAKHPIDRFLLARLTREGLGHAGEADRYTLIRRAALDLTGLPPTADEVEQFVNDAGSQAYERLIDRLLAKTAYGEHWARMWLDLARYADSCGYADDPPRTIWAYRDYVIRAFNANQPFDQFTIEQLAGDLLPAPSDEQRLATAFHRNTLTNNEGGTNDEEFRNVAIVDRVNTTLAVWMGTTVSCCQCHNHKYDPLSQEEFFRLFAFFNSTADADRPDESPLLEVWSQEQLQQKADWQAEIAELERVTGTPTPAVLAAQQAWEESLATAPQWLDWRPTAVLRQSGGTAQIAEDSAIWIADSAKTDTYTVDLSPPAAPKSHADSPTTGPWTALRIESLPHESLPNHGAGYGDGNFVVTRVSASITPPAGSRLRGRWVRVELPGEARILSLAELQVFRGSDNLAPAGAATQSSIAFDGPANLAIDNNTSGEFAARSTTHTATEDNPWWEVDLGGVYEVDRMVVWNRTDAGLASRLKDARLSLLDENRRVVWEQRWAEPPSPSIAHELSGVRPLKFATAAADYNQNGFSAAMVLESQKTPDNGWAVGPQLDRPHQLTLVFDAPVEIPPGSQLALTIEQLSPHENHVLGHFRVAGTTSTAAAVQARTPPSILAGLEIPADQRTEAQRAELTRHYLSMAPGLQPERDRLASLKQQLAELKPTTTAPVMRELPAEQRRPTHIQLRGNFLALGNEVTPGTPVALHPLRAGEPVNRLTLARWVMDEENPLTARVLVNRYWEAIFGIGLVRTSEEFGAQGELPSHPELLDWLAVEFQESGWDLKRLLKLMVTSAAYRQSARVTPQLLERDPDNRLLARGPRFRLSAEMIRDQALEVGGLLSSRSFGPPVRPLQPTLGVSAAFGSGIDWKTSDGEDRHRRGIYTLWRRSNPYPSMAAFDAPNREVCTLRRERTNTPLQALVTLNDPVYIEAAQGLARRTLARGGTVHEKADYAFRQCLIRPPTEPELVSLASLYQRSRARFEQDSVKAERMATNPIGPAPPGTELSELAAWTLVGNVLLNLDETLMKP